jgi:hypothetical protein
MFGFHPNLLISHRIPPKAKLKKDRATVRLEDDLPFPNFDHGPPRGCIRYSEAAHTRRKKAG